MSSEEREFRNQVLAALTSVAMPVASCGWRGSVAGRQFIAASPWVDEKGPDTANRAFHEALERAGLNISTANIFVLSPENPLTRGLEE